MIFREAASNGAPGRTRETRLKAGESQGSRGGRWFHPLRELAVTIGQPALGLAEKAVFAEDPIREWTKADYQKLWPSSRGGPAPGPKRAPYWHLAARLSIFVLLTVVPPYVDRSNVAHRPSLTMTRETLAWFSATAVIGLLAGGAVVFRWAYFLARKSRGNVDRGKKWKLPEKWDLPES